MEPSSSYPQSKRIASNTFVLFVRMFLLTVINLYAVRLVLRGLGEKGYGVFTAIASVVAIASLFNVVLALSVQRFYSFYLGKNDTARLKEIFSTSVNIVAILSLAVFILLETIGLWFVSTQLVIPEEQRVAALWAYQFSILIFIASMLQIPYTAAIFSHEDMGTYTWISTVECLLKLLVAYALCYVFPNSMALYAAGLLATSAIVLALYVSMGRRYEECHYSRPRNKALYKEISTFSGWTFFGSVSNAGMIQGNTILLNVYFGPVINASFGIALQINNAFSALCNTMVLAFRPPMIKAYAEHRFDYLNKLFSVSNKFVYYLLLMVAIPIVAEMDTILDFWLDATSPHIVLFSRLIVVYVVCLAMNSPITIIMQASGHIKEYHLPVESTSLACLPVTWILFAIGFPSHYVFVSMIGVCCVAHLVRLWCLKRYYDGFSVSQYFISFVFPAVLVTLLCVVNAYFIGNNIENSALRLFLTALSTVFLSLALVSFVGLDRQEKLLLKDFIKKSNLKSICRR